MNDIGPYIEPSGVERIRKYVSRTADQSSSVATWEEAIGRGKAVAGHVFPNNTEEQWDEFARKIFIEAEPGVIRLDYDPAVGNAFRDTTKGKEEGQDDKGDKNKANAAPELWPIFHAMHTVPLLVLRGATSDILSQETLDRMIAEHPNAKAVVVANVGHCPALDEPVVVAALDDWKKQHGKH
tara:strand:+ start:102 stop:647 length:546 start_codon:yes stop_codon:yes gene_type:complete